VNPPPPFSLAPYPALGAPLTEGLEVLGLRWKPMLTPLSADPTDLSQGNWGVWAFRGKRYEATTKEEAP
jgi:hypothetical protein